MPGHSLLGGRRDTKQVIGLYQTMLRVPVVDSNHQPLMPTTSGRARKWIELGKAIKRWSDSGQFYVQLTQEPSGRAAQDIVIGVDHIPSVDVTLGDAKMAVSQLLNYLHVDVPLGDAKILSASAWNVQPKHLKESDTTDCQSQVSLLLPS
ncbi:MAG: RRXRR domain-containing protein [Nostoc sp.]